MLDLSVTSEVSLYLAQTDFAAKDVQPLTGGVGNFTFRVFLIQPFQGHSTVVLKHAKPYVAAHPDFPFTLERQVFEVEALKRVRAILAEDSLITVPEVYLFDQEAHAIIMEDAGPSASTLKQYVLDGKCQESTAQRIGTAIGEFTGLLHTWGKINLASFGENKEARKLSSWIIWGRVVSTLNGTDKLETIKESLDVSESDLKVIEEVASRLSASILTANETLVHGDLWSGNTLVSLDSKGKLKRIYVVDWELSKPGNPSVELGQFCAELHLLHLYHEEHSAMKLAVSAFIEAYTRNSRVSWSKLDVVRHIGGHIVVLSPRISWGDSVRTRQVIKQGVELLTRPDDLALLWL
ncbi:kinase-like domain-containing protein [Mycena floridula]|nr:kinase-like domain-containing protein [Mycena floridula]